MLDLLDQAIKQVCPTDGVSVGRKEDKQTWRIDFKDGVTQEQVDAAYEVLDNFDINAKDPIEERIKEYGTPAEQLERIIENGLDAEIARVAEIKKKHPK